MQPLSEPQGKWKFLVHLLPWQAMDAPLQPHTQQVWKQRDDEQNRQQLPRSPPQPFGGEGNPPTSFMSYIRPRWITVPAVLGLPWRSQRVSGWECHTELMGSH